MRHHSYTRFVVDGIVASVIPGHIDIPVGRKVIALGQRYTVVDHVLVLDSKEGEDTSLHTHYLELDV